MHKTVRIHFEREKSTNKKTLRNKLKKYDDNFCHCFMLTTVTKIWIFKRAINAINKNEHSMNYLSHKDESRMSM